MKITKLLLVVLMILLLSVSVQAYFRNSYWECTSQGEASQGDFFGRRAGDVCQTSCCILCVSDDIFVDCLSGSAQPQCTCQAGGGGEIDITPPEIIFNSPVDGATYNTDDILLDVESDETNLYMKRAFDTSSLRNWCTNCNSATLTERRMHDGEHTVRVQAKDYAGNINEKQISFIVDTQAPEVHALRPGNNAYVSAGNQEFTVDYTESSVESVKLFYKKAVDSTYQSVSFNDCENGEEQSCSTTVNLGSYGQGERLNAYVEIKDQASTTTSDTILLIVDDVLSELPFVISSPSEDDVVDTRSVNFEIQSFLPNADFKYSKDGGNKFSNLCTSGCDDFEKKISLSDGDNDVIVRLIDEFGNNYDQDISLFIDSRSPSVKSIEPRGGRDPIGGEPFIVEYTEEEEVVEVALRYRDQAGAEFELVRTDCPTGRSVVCEFDIDLDHVHGQEITYFAEVRDRASSDVSREETAVVDTVDPVLDAGELAEVQGKKVTFELTVDESVTIEYQDNGGRWNSLCKSCVEYSRSKSFKDGAHNIVVRATDGAGNYDEVVYDILVDSRAPRANGLEIDDATNGAILFEYVELNPVEVVLNYRPAGEENDWDQAVFTHCPSAEKNGECVLNVDLTSYEGEELEFFATIEDILGEVDDTRVEEAVVDTVDPVLDLIAPIEGQTFDRRLPVSMTTNEEVTFSYSDGGGEFKQLCSRCDEYDRERSMGAGNRVLVFRATDAAGNFVEETRNVLGGVSE